jgi:hypothetical protein
LTTRAAGRTAGTDGLNALSAGFKKKKKEVKFGAIWKRDALGINAHNDRIVYYFREWTNIKKNVSNILSQKNGERNRMMVVEVERWWSFLQFHKCQHILGNGLRSLR